MWMHNPESAYCELPRSSGRYLNVSIIEERRRSLIILITKVIRAAVCLMRELAESGDVDWQLTPEFFRAFSNSNLTGEVNLKNQCSLIADFEEMRLEGGFFSVQFVAVLGSLHRAMLEHVGLIHSCPRLRTIVPWECHLVENYTRQIRPFWTKLFARLYVSRASGHIKDTQESDSESIGTSLESASSESSSSLDNVDSADLESSGSSFANRRLCRTASSRRGGARIALSSPKAVANCASWLTI